MATDFSRFFPRFPAIREILQPLVSLYIEKEKEIFFLISCTPPRIFRWPPVRARGGGVGGKFPVFDFFACFAFTTNRLQKAFDGKKTGKTGKFREKFRRYPSAASNRFTEAAPGCDWQRIDWRLT